MGLATLPVRNRPVANQRDMCPITATSAPHRREARGNNGCPLSDENYIYTINYQEAYTEAQLVSAPNSDKIEAVTYFDGLGRPMQSVGIRAGADKLRNNLINWEDNWTLGSGSAPFFDQNGATSENERVMGTDAYGNTSMLWRCGQR